MDYNVNKTIRVSQIWNFLSPKMFEKIRKIFPCIKGSTCEFGFFHSFAFSLLSIIRMLGHVYSRFSAQQIKFSLSMWPNPQFVALLVTFTVEILNGKFHFCAVFWRGYSHLSFRPKAFQYLLKVKLVDRFAVFQEVLFHWKVVLCAVRQNVF